MQYSHSKYASESKMQWKPIKQMSYMAKLNSLVAEHSADLPYDWSSGSGNNQQENYSPNYNQSTGFGQQMNTWSSDKKYHQHQSFGQCNNQLQTQN